MTLAAWLVVLVALVPPFLALALLGIGWLRIRAEESARREIADFLQRFPGNCPVCALWRWGRNHGVDYAPAPPLHRRCPEGRS